MSGPSFVKGFVFRMASDSSVTLLALANTVLIARMLGPEGRGVYALLMTGIGLVTMLFGEGIRQSSIYMAGKDARNAPQLFTNTLVYGLAVLALLSVLTWTAASTPDVWGTHPAVPILVASLLIAALTQMFQGVWSVLLGLNRLREYNTLPIVFAVVFLCGNLVALKVFRAGLAGVMWSWLLAAGLSLALASIWLWRATGISRSFDWVVFRNGQKVGLRGMASSLMISLLFRIDIFLVGSFLGTRAAGIYSISVVAAEMFQKVSNAAGTVLLPRVTAGSGHEKDVFTARVSRTILFVTLCMGMGAVATGKWLLPWVFGSDFAESYLPLVCMLPGVLAVAAASIVNTNLWGRGYPAVAVIAPALALGANVLLNLWLIPAMGLIGAGIATSIAYTLWGVIIFDHFIRHSSVSLRDLLVPEFRIALR